MKTATNFTKHISTIFYINMIKIRIKMLFVFIHFYFTQEHNRKYLPYVPYLSIEQIIQKQLNVYKYISVVYIFLKLIVVHFINLWFHKVKNICLSIYNWYDTEV